MRGTGTVVMDTPARWMTWGLPKPSRSHISSDMSEDMLDDTDAHALRMRFTGPCRTVAAIIVWLRVRGAGAGHVRGNARSGMPKRDTRFADVSDAGR